VTEPPCFDRPLDAEHTLAFDNNLLDSETLTDVRA
jgi:hypothetical protein